MTIRILIFALFIFGWLYGYGQAESTVTMKDYVDMQADLSRKLAEIQFENIQDNVNKANASMEKRLDGMNEFREALKDSNATYITRAELIAWVTAAAGLFWGWSRHKRESEGKNIVSGDKAEVKK